MCLGGGHGGGGGRGDAAWARGGGWRWWCWDWHWEDEPQRVHGRRRPPARRPLRARRRRPRLRPLPQERGKHLYHLRLARCGYDATSFVYCLAQSIQSAAAQCSPHPTSLGSWCCAIATAPAAQQNSQAASCCPRWCLRHFISSDVNFTVTTRC